MHKRTVFSGMLQNLVELTSIVFRPELLDAEFERRCKLARKEVYEDEQTAVHSEFATDGGVHTNRVECLWSLVNPWLEKFCDPSKAGLEQSVRTYRFV